MRKTLYCGVDLHSNNAMYVVSDSQDRPLLAQRLPNELPVILQLLEPFRRRLKVVAVESTYNWYWLVDMLQEHGYPVKLANPGAIKQYSGLKYTDDEDDAFWLADLCRLGILPTGYIYPRAERPVRDLLRRRLMFVRHRATYKNSLRSMVMRHTGKNIGGAGLYKLTDNELSAYLSDEVLVHMARQLLQGISLTDEIIIGIEEAVLSRVQLKHEYRLLQTLPGVGKILALTIMLEAGNITRFRGVGNYSSYCRCVKSERRSNGKKKGENNRKNGNKYLGWAYLEAAHFAILHYPEIRRFYERKKREAHEFIALKAVSNKLAKASYYIMRDHVPYDAHRCFANGTAANRDGVMEKPKL